MGYLEGWPQPTGFHPGRSLYFSAISSSSSFDYQWDLAEHRITELLGRIQPNRSSEERRKAVADYVERLIRRRFDCQVLPFGSVPLKTYLPDGDIDLTVFSRHQNFKDSWATEVQSIFENEEKRQDAEFCVTEVQCIHAEVKIVKCLVENIVVDVSFNQLGGLCTLCFLEEVDSLIGQNHLFKRSIILVKAWCYYESRLLGAHHGLISTYALETLVLYIFNIFHGFLRGPFEVLCKFLDYFSNFNWDKYCVSLRGPVPLLSLPEMDVESPLKNEYKVLLSEDFLEACSDKYVHPKVHGSQSRDFSSKYLNVIDPLRPNNNLGRSVSQANFFRIRSAFNRGAVKLVEVFKSSKEDFVKSLDDFFFNTWDRHKSAHRPDAPDSVFLPLEALHVGALPDSHETSKEQKDTKDDETIEKLHFADESKLDMKRVQQMTEALDLQSVANKLVDLRTPISEDAQNQSVSLTKGISMEYPSDCTVEMKASNATLETSQRYKLETSDAQQESHWKEEKITKGSGVFAETLPSRAQMAEKGSPSTGELDKFKMKRSISDDRLRVPDKVHLPLGVRSIGSAKDLASVNQRILDPKNIEPGEPRDQTVNPEFAPNANDRKPRVDADLMTLNPVMQWVLPEEVPCVQVQNPHGHTVTHNGAQSGGSSLLNEAGFKDGDNVFPASLDKGQSSLDEHNVVNYPISTTIPEDLESNSKIGSPISRVSTSSDLYGQIPLPFPLPTQMPVYMPVTATVPLSYSTVALTGPPPPSEGSHLRSTMSSIADDSLRTVAVPHSPPYLPMQIPQGPVPPPLPPYLGVPSLAFVPSIPNKVENQLTSFPSLLAEEKHQPDSWQRLEQLQHLNSLVAYSNMNATAADQLPQVETNWQEGAGHARFGTDVSVKSVGKGHGGKGSKSVSDREISSKGVSPTNGDLLEAVKASNVSASTIEEGASCRPAENIDDEAVMAVPGYLHLLPSPVVGSGSVVYPNIMSSVPALLINKAVSSASSNTQSLSSYPPVKNESLYMSSMGPPVIPSSSYNQLPPPSIGIPVPIGPQNAFHPITEISSRSLNSLQKNMPPVNNQHTIPGASLTYYSAGTSFTPFTLCNTLYNMHPGSEDGLGMDLVTGSAHGISLEDSINNSGTVADHQVPTGPHVFSGVWDRPKPAGFLENSVLKLDNGMTEEASIYTASKPAVDLLSSDFVSHLRNLEYGRLCQDSGLYAFVLPPPILPPPMYLHGNQLWEGPGRPLHGGLNIQTQVLSNGQGQISGVPTQNFCYIYGSAPSAFPGQVGFGIENPPRAWNGSGTYSPSPRYGTYRNRQSSVRNQLGGYIPDPDHDGNFGYSSRLRGLGRWPNNQEGRSQGHYSGTASMDRHADDEKTGDRSRQETVQRRSSQWHGTFSTASASANSFLPSKAAIGTDWFPHGHSSSSSSLQQTDSLSTYPMFHSYTTGFPLMEGQFLEPVQVVANVGSSDSSEGSVLFNHSRRLTGVTSSGSLLSAFGDEGSNEPASSSGQTRAIHRPYQLNEEDFPPLPFVGQQGSS